MDMVVFDCDGVLVDSEHILCGALQGELAGLGLDLPMDQVKDRFLGGTISMVAQKVRDTGLAVPDSWVDAFYEQSYERLADEVELVPGITSVLDALDAANVPYAVGSNGRIRKMEVTLGRTGLLDRFKGRMLSAQDCPSPKPAPDVYLAAMALVGADPKRCAVVEDSAPGAMAGRASGAKVFGFHADTPRAKLAPHCDVLFDQMAYLPGLLGL